MFKPGRRYSVSVYMPGEDPTRLRILQTFNSTLTGVYCARPAIGEASERWELNQPGVLLLAGKDTDGSTTTLRILAVRHCHGELRECDRESSGNWTVAVAFLFSRFTFSHILWLAHRLREAALASGRCRVLEDAPPRKPDVGEFRRAEAEEFLPTIGGMLPLMGIDELWPLKDKPHESHASGGDDVVQP